MPPAPNDAVRPAATLLLLRDAPSGLEVLLLRRADRASDRMSGAHVFPGGAVDEADRRLRAFAHGLDDAAASRRLGMAAGGLDFFVAAIRECFEESGLLLADGASELPAEARLDFEGLVVDRGLRLRVDRLAYFGHWLSPAGLVKRFDTRFFVARAPAGQMARADGRETVEQRWVRPSDALADGSGLKLMEITRHILRWLAPFRTAEACVAHARALVDVPLQVPRRAVGRAGPRTIMPGEPAYAEIGRLDPDGTRHDARHEIEPGVPVRLSPRIVRVTAPNPGPMTGPGTNSYLVGGGPANEWVVIDPGPDVARHRAALLAAAPGAIRAILVTHTHLDHSPGAAALSEATGAALIGRPAECVEHQDSGFRPDRIPADGARIPAGDAFLRAIHTPGHAANHVCYLLEAEKTLFTGDHVMQGSTVVIRPPDGDMAAYLRSLQALMHEDIEWLAPGHGFLIGEPRAALEALVRHRLAREAKVRAALALRPASLDELLPRVYDDVPPRLHAVARHSLRAHLLKLASEGQALENETGWASIRREA